MEPSPRSSSALSSSGVKMDVLVLGELVALHHVIPLDLHAVAGADVLLLQARPAVLWIQLKVTPAE
jgi:hypothetical protein